MKATELMIGDWVQDITPVVIDAMSNEDICTYRAQYGYITANPSNLKPIPLTAEILEKNGFKLKKDCTSAWIWDFKENYSVQVSGNPDGFIPQTITIYTPTRDMAYGAGYQRTLSDLPINGVHELQHALRLCGIDKEIVL